MACCLSDQCSFYKLHKQGSDKGWDFLLAGYCEGQYDWLCARRRYFDSTGTVAPSNIHPIDVLTPDIAAVQVGSLEIYAHPR